jgi:hypothetical protein
MLERAQIHRGEGGCFYDVFLLWCLYECPVSELYSRGYVVRIQFATNKSWRFVRELSGHLIRRLWIVVGLGFARMMPVEIMPKLI